MEEIFQMRKINLFTHLLLISFTGFLWGCSNQNSDKMILSNIDENANIEHPVEFVLDQKFEKDEILVARSIGDPAVKFILQKSASFFSDKNYTYSAIIPDSINEGEYIVEAINAEANFSLNENDKGQLTVYENEDPVLTYNFGMQLGNVAPERYRRSSYIHPVYDLNGNSITDDFPEDHYHHRGISLMWPKVYIDSIRYDLWHIYGQQNDLKGIHQIFEKWMYKEAGPISANIGLKNYWQVENGPRVMDEQVELRVFRSIKNYRAIDVKIILKAKTNISFEGQTKKGYGGFNFRFAPRVETTITSNYGKEEDSDLKPLPWADLSARFNYNDNVSGAAVFQHSSNIDYPAGWCLRHYGFLGVAWPGVERYEMEPGESLVLRFRILVHQGDSNESNIATLYELFDKPPKLELN
jgi:hypothetical protein